MSLSAQQVETLLRPIKPKRVMTAQGQSHVPAYDIIAHLTRVFGFAGWDKEIRSIELVEERNDVPNKTGWYVTYRCHMRLTIRDPDGNVVKVIEDGATGSAQNMPGLGDAHDFAYKNAISYAIKRCAKDLGDQFGLSLYNKGSTGALLGTTLVGGNEEPHGDVEEHAPVPLSLGNDERQVDQDTGEILTTKPTGAVPEVGGDDGATKGDDTSTVNDESLVTPVTGGAVNAAPPEPKPTQNQMRRLFALMGGNGIGENNRKAWASDELGRPVESFNDLSAADVRALCDTLTKVSA